MIVQILFVLSFVLGVITAFLAIASKPKWYWVAGLCMYVFSFIGSWSIGGYTLSMAFALWALAIGHSLNVIKQLSHSVIAVIIGLALWGMMIKTLDDFWWFLPFSMFSWLVYHLQAFFGG